MHITSWVWCTLGCEETPRIETLKTYYLLTKPGIVRGNALAASAGFFLGTMAGGFSATLFVLMLIGLSLVIGSACVFNNVMDRRIDALMARTKKRGLVTGRVQVAAALVYGTILGLAGFMVLAFGTNLLATALAAGGWFFYVVVYGWAKRRSPWGTEVGSISGAIPPVVGYVAVSGQLDITALLLFLVLTFWQMPHFYAIAIFRQSDYHLAKIPVLPDVKGIAVTVRRMIFYVCAFVVTVFALALFGPASWLFGIATCLVSIFWLRKVLAGRHTTDHVLWAKKVFGTSLLVLLTFCVMSLVDMIARSILQ